jgi:hypothetical protein
MHYSLLNFNPRLPIGWHIFQIASNSFDKRQMAACRLFRRVLVPIREMYQPAARGELHSAVFKTVWAN